MDLCLIHQLKDSTDFQAVLRRKAKLVTWWEICKKFDVPILGILKMVEHLKVAKVKAERISKEKSQNVAEELVFAFGKTLTKRVRMLQDEFSRLPLGPPLRIVFHPNSTHQRLISQSKTEVSVMRGPKLPGPEPFLKSQSGMTVRSQKWGKSTQISEF